MSTNEFIPIGDAAHQLGIPANALRIYLDSIGTDPEDINSDRASTDVLHAIEDEIRSRTATLRLDELARISLISEWLSSTALQNLTHISSIESKIETVQQSVAEIDSGNIAIEQIDALNRRVSECEESISKNQNNSGGHTMSLLASIQQMVEAQGRDLDTMRGQLNDLRAKIEAVDQSVSLHGANHDRLITALKRAVDNESPQHE